MLTILAGVFLGDLRFTNPQARQMIADQLRAGGEEFFPANMSKTLQKRLTELNGCD